MWYDKWDMKPKAGKSSAIWVPDNVPTGVCLWKMPNEGYISDGDGYLSMEGPVGSAIVESKMRKAAHYWTGNYEGVPAWFPGYRQISDAEHDDQMARLVDGKIPDPVDEIRQARGEV